MKILFLIGAGAMQMIRMGYAHAFTAAGHNCGIWQPNVKPAFDMFAEFEPDMVVCGTWELDRAITKCLVNRPQVKLMLWGSNWGDFDKQIDKEDTVLLSNNNEKYNVEHIVHGRTDIIFTYYHQKWADVTHNKWRNLGLTPVGLPLAADLTVHKPSLPNEEYAAHVTFVGGYWPYKAINLDKYLLPLCHPSMNLNIKIFGYGGWPVPQFLGSIDNNKLSEAFASAVICPCIYEPLSSKYGFDVSERAYKVIASGGFCISEEVESAKHDIFTDNEVVFVNDPQSFRDTVKYFLTCPEERLPFIERGIKSSKTKHNYFIRARDALQALGITEGVDKLNDIITKVNAT